MICVFRAIIILRVDTLSDNLFFLSDMVLLSSLELMVIHKR